MAALRFRLVPVIERILENKDMPQGSWHSGVFKIAKQHTIYGIVYSTISSQAHLQS